MKRKVAIVHWAPLELYPPVTNLARFLNDTGKWSVTLHSTTDVHGRRRFAERDIEVHRSANPSGQSKAGKIRSYARFNSRTARLIIASRPDVVIYFEPTSAIPVVIAKLLRPQLPVFVHHHEYHTPGEFLTPGMTMARLGHAMERKAVFGRARWVSHTNEERLKLFQRDVPEVAPDVARVLPNFPPTSWQDRIGEPSAAPPVRLVYVGSLSLRDTFIREVVTWIRGLRGKATLDVFAYNTDEPTRGWLRAHADDYLRYHPEGIEYDDIPSTLSSYHTGLLLYKAESVNYRHNATNKLFEYLACGLNVLYPAEMSGVRPYARTTPPYVIEADFTKLAQVDIETLSRREALTLRPTQFAEDVLPALEEEMWQAVTE